MPGDAADSSRSFSADGRGLISPRRARNNPPPTPTATPNATISRLPGCFIPYVTASECQSVALVVSGGLYSAGLVREGLTADFRFQKKDTKRSHLASFCARMVLDFLNSG